MFKRLLTCLARITGLAAVATPANAGFVEAISEQFQSSAPSAQPGKSTECSCSSHGAVAGTKKGATANCRKRDKRITIIIPTVQFGADRAFE
jgi:hypothetical protein